MENIIVAVDVEDNVLQLMTHAEALAEKFGSKIWIIHVTDPHPKVNKSAGPKYVRSVLAEELREEHRYLQNIRKYVNPEIECEALLIEGGSTVDGLLQESEKLKADLVIVGIHEHGFLHKAFVGNTTMDILENTKVPLMAIPLD